jgi:hypothetical protein
MPIIVYARSPERSIGLFHPDATASCSHRRYPSQCHHCKHNQWRHLVKLHVNILLGVRPSAGRQAVGITIRISSR